MARRTVRVSVFAALVAWSFVACSLFVDTNGLSGGSVSDASSSDAPVSDASSDAPSARDAAVLCDAMFCDDFERADVQGSWDTVDQENDGTLAIVDDGTGNRVLRATIATGSVSATPIANLGKALPGTVSTVTYRARMKVTGDVNDSARVTPWLRVDQPDGTYGSMGVSMEQKYTPEGTFLWGYASHSSFDASGGSGGLNFASPPPLGTWTDYSLEVDLTNRTIRIRVGGVIAYDGALYNDSPNFAPGTVHLYAGLLGTATGFKDNSAFELDVDDVAVDYSP